MTIGSRLNLRMFLEGIEVPAIGIRATFQENGPAVATAQMVATDQVQDIKPRSVLKAFVYDDSPSMKLHAYNDAPVRLGPQDPRRWKLLFYGEVAGMGFALQSNQRQAMLQCIGPTSYWDAVRQHFCNFRNGGVEMFENAFVGTNLDEQHFFDVVTKDVHSNIYVWLTQSKVKLSDGSEYPSIYLGVQRILREMFFAANDFYGRAFNRLRVGDTLVGLPQDKTAAELLELRYFEKFVKNRIGGAGSYVTLRQLVDITLGLVLHSYCTVPFPRFDPSGEAKGMAPSEISSVASGDLPSWSNSFPGASLNYTVIKPDAWFLAPPSCNVIFPHQVNSMQWQRNYLQEPTRLFFRTSLLFTGRDKWVTERFYAPALDPIKDLCKARGGFNSPHIWTDVMPHEEYVGINPIETWQSDLQAYVAKGPRREYLAQLADYMFWRFRFESRTVSFSGPLNRSLVPGYPAAILGGVGTPSVRFPRSVVGHLSTLVVSVDQNGGWSHGTLVGARFWDEVLETAEGQTESMDQIAARATDGFMDERYEAAWIGEEVYRKVLGCDSVADYREYIYPDDSTYTEAPEYDVTSAEWALDGELIARLQLPNENRTMRGIAYLQMAYTEAARNGYDLDAFTRGITQRPMANMVDMLGITAAAGSGNSDYEAMLRRDGCSDDGFLCAVTDPDAADLASETRYNLKKHLEARRAPVQAYVDSLRYRGMRG